MNIQSSSMILAVHLRFANLKNSKLYENLPVQKMAILSRRLILLAILLYEQFMHYTHICIKMQISYDLHVSFFQPSKITSLIL